MGLDMFLNGIKYYPAKYDEDFNVIEKRKKVSILETDWRKSNQIHKWFVDNVQYGEDDCHSYELTREQLIELRDTCKNVLDNPKLAKQLLPTQSGFFFGGTEYDEWYFKDLEYTVKELNRILNSEDEYDWFEYQSSW